MNNYIVKFADRRKKDVYVKAENRKEAIEVVFSKHGAGFLVEFISKKNLNK